MRARLCFLLFLVASLAVPVTAAGAASSGGNSKTKIQQDLDQVSRQQQAAFAQLKQAQAQKAAVDAKAAQLDAQVSAAQAQLDPLAAEAARLGAQYFTVAVQLQAKEAELEAARKRLDVSAVQMYRDALARQLLRHPLGVAARAARHRQRVPRPRLEPPHSCRAARHGAARRARRPEEDRRRPEGQGRRGRCGGAGRARPRSRHSGPRSSRRARRPPRPSPTSRRPSTRSVSRSSNWNRSSRRCRRSPTASRGHSARRGGAVGQGSPCQFRPVAGGITSPYGYRIHPVLGRRILHAGDDLAASTGTPIHACRAGTVVIAGPQGGYGNAVVIDHGGGMATLYGHQSRIGVSVGQHVEAGQVIGYVGMTRSRHRPARPLRGADQRQPDRPDRLPLTIGSALSAAARELAARATGSLTSRDVRGLLVGLGRDPQVGLERLPALRELRLGVLVGDGGDDDDVLAVLPVHRRGDPVVGGELERVDDAQDLVEVAAGRSPGR